MNRLNKLPDAITQGIDPYDFPVIKNFINALLASGKAIIDTDINNHGTRTISRLIIELD